MSKKIWGYIVKIFISDTDGMPVENFQFEVIGFSPFRRPINWEIMESEEYDSIDNPMLIGNFVSSIGDHNTLTIKKSNDLKSNALKQIFIGKESLFGIRLDIAPLSQIPKNLTGEARSNKITLVALASVQLKDVSITHFYSFVNRKKPFDVVAFKCEKVRFRFHGRDK